MSQQIRQMLLEKQERLLRLKQVLEFIPVSKSTWWAWCANGKAPKPIKLGEKTTCWRYSEILDFIQSQGV